MISLAQADLGSTIGITGPVAIVTAILGFLLKAYLEKRREDREETKSERESESGIVETTRQALEIVRSQMVAMSVDMERLRGENQELRERIEALEEENRQLTRRKGGGRHAAGREQHPRSI